MSLFPFLAVLICMMGALIVLLVMVVHQAQVYAASGPAPAAIETPQEPAPFPPPADPQEPAGATDPLEREERQRQQQQRLAQEKERDEHLWRTSILETKRQEKVNELAEKRLELGHLEDHIRQLEQQWKTLRDEVDRMKQQASPAPQQDQRLAELRQQQQQLEAELQGRRQQLAQQPQSYAILPYEGPNGTRRRPIYLECTAQGIVIQPAGVTLTGEELRGPGGPGNPLDAALRAVREYWRETGVLETKDPYPLLLVRPDGVDAYSVARASLAAWDDEFGYELVGQELDLSFGAADEVLAERVEKAIALAVERQQLLAAAMPKAYNSSRQMGAMRASRNGGFEPVGGQVDMDAEAERELMGRDPTAPSSGSPSAASQSPRQPSLQGPANGGGADGSRAPDLQVAGGGGAPQQPISAARGGNWALLDYNPAATAWSRPVWILCLADRLVVVQKEGDTAPSRTVMTNDGPLREKMDAFAELVRKHVEGWGVAPARGYWKPMLFVKVGPGAEAKFVELQTLLRNSGFEIRRDKR